jgi:hypothetical protein
MHRLVEEGGMVFTSGLKLFVRPASVAGTVLDSAGRPFPGAIVRLGGTPFATRSGADGTFRLDSLPASRFTLVAEHPSYTQLGSFLGDEPVDLREGSVVNANIRAPNTKALVERLCEGKLPKDDNGAIRVIVVDSATSRPLPSLRVWLRWAGRFRGNVEQPSSLSPTAVGGFETVTDASGASTFCDVPAGIPLYFSAVMANGRQASDSTSLRLEPKELKAVTVHTRRP